MLRQDNQRIKSHQSALWQAEGASDSESDDKLDEVEQPTVKAEHSPVDAFQIPEKMKIKLNRSKKWKWDQKWL